MTDPWRRTGHLYDPAIDVLVVCTGNQCRSPMGEVILRDRLAARGVEATVHSAGLVSEGAPAEPHTARALAKRGFDVSEHDSTRLTPEAVAAADLVIGMAREHVREAAVMVDGALRHSFTLRELVRRGEAVGPRSDDEPFAAWLARLHEGRRAADLMGADPVDDVADPMGLSRRAHERTAAEVEQLVDAFVALAFPAGAAGAP